MKRVFALIFIFLSFQVGAYAQGANNPSPYNTSWVDGAISAGGIGLSYWGLIIMKEKKTVSAEELRRIDAGLEAAKAKIPAFDRWAAGYYSPDAEKISDIPFYASFGLPLLFLAHEQTRQNAAQIGLLYLQTMAITGALYAQVNGRVNRIRPLVYSQEAGVDVRLDDKGKNSFDGGHVTATAAATFFAAKVFNDFFPNSTAKPYVWAGAALVPAAVGYLRLKAGKHFLSDNLIGYAIGAGVGILVPHLHKRDSGISLFQDSGFLNNPTFGIKYRF